MSIREAIRSNGLANKFDCLCVWVAGEICVDSIETLEWLYEQMRFPNRNVKFFIFEINTLKKSVKKWKYPLIQVWKNKENKFLPWDSVCVQTHVYRDE